MRRGRMLNISIAKFSYGEKEVLKDIYIQIDKPKILRNTNICDTNQCQYNLWDNWLGHKTV